MGNGSRLLPSILNWQSTSGRLPELHQAAASLKQGTVFRAAMAAGTRLLPKRALLHLRDLYLRPEGSRVKR
ncbi:hypothetical protein JZ751_005717 [Albula glossodonta]|uniref:Uncharacterized protein n=1 Tax=Albula glossodonta TaxID=121402 RepID=A0A8T2NBI4_9TELE|nr:hypothetical protein JZ751_005717 [Albula glossodonta]